ncbi:hypothetical protein DXG01_011193 [Tephrocybe rancida]|nr:hypothetical protein DXG01_011193 [Tephrocybe rancida]
MEDRIYGASEEELLHISDLLQKGASGARSDDTRSLKSAIIELITPRGQNLTPPLSRHSKMERGFHHERTESGSNSTPESYSFEAMSGLSSYMSAMSMTQKILGQTFKHIFTSLSSVEKENKATWSGNARIHSMVSVTRASITYVATQVRFTLSSSSTFSRTDRLTDSDRFYNTVLAVLNDPNELVETVEQVFPGHEEQACRSANPKTALARIKARQAALKLMGQVNSSNS